jgi:hypothetical protein
MAAVSEDDLGRDIEAFLAETPMPSATKAVAQSLERMRANVRFAERERSRLTDLLG